MAGALRTPAHPCSALKAKVIGSWRARMRGGLAQLGSLAVSPKLPSFPPTGIHSTGLSQPVFIPDNTRQ